MKVTYLPALSDNYIWIIEREDYAVVVDPGESAQVLEYLKTNNLKLVAVLLTHGHSDHIGGLDILTHHYPHAKVYGPREVESMVHQVVEDGDRFKLIVKEVEVFKTAGHTKNHVSYLIDDDLFVGDALFSAGCGRVFTKDYQAQYDSLQKFGQLPENIKVYSGHEYTQTNLEFSLTIEPENKALKKALAEVKELRQAGRATLPTTIGREKEINLLMQAPNLENFIELRNKRDEF